MSVRFYSGGETYDRTASIPDQIITANNTLVGSGVESPDSNFRLGLTNKGENTMEI